MFRDIEEFVDRYKTVPIADPHYRFWWPETNRVPWETKETPECPALLIDVKKAAKGRRCYCCHHTQTS